MQCFIGIENITDNFPKILGFCRGNSMLYMVVCIVITLTDRVGLCRFQYREMALLLEQFSKGLGASLDDKDIFANQTSFNILRTAELTLKEEAYSTKALTKLSAENWVNC